MGVKIRADGSRRITPMCDTYKVVSAVVPEEWRLLDVVVLKFNDQHGSEYRTAHERRVSYQLWLHKIAILQEYGKIAIVESGMDCDGVQYDGHVHLVEATKEAIAKEIDRILDYADGPAYFDLERPSIAHNIEYRSRDRILEAFEDGHAHSISFGSMDD